MRGGAERHGDLLAGEVANGRLVDLELRLHDAVVVFGIAHRHVEHLEVLTGRGRDDEWRHALADGDLHVARGHRRAHRGARVEADPVDPDAHLLFVGAVHLRELERHRPLEEVGDGDFVEMTARIGRLPARERRSCDRRR